MRRGSGRPRSCFKRGRASVFRWRRSQDLLNTGQGASLLRQGSHHLSARQALEWGIVTRVVPDDRLMAEAETLAGELARGAKQALGGTKRLLQHSATESLETQMELESRGIADAARGSESAEGIAAFLS